MDLSELLNLHFPSFCCNEKNLVDELVTDLYSIKAPLLSTYHMAHDYSKQALSLRTVAKLLSSLVILLLDVRVEFTA